MTFNLILVVNVIEKIGRESTGWQKVLSGVEDAHAHREAEGDEL